MDANAIAEIIGYTLPLGIAVYIGSYVGVFKRQDMKLSGGEKVGLFFGLWLLSAVLLILFATLLSSVDLGSVPRESVYLAGPLIVGIIVGRKIVKWRRDKRASENQAANHHPDP